MKSLKRLILDFCEYLAQKGYTTSEIAEELYFLGEQELVAKRLDNDRVSHPGPFWKHDCTQCVFLGKLRRDRCNIWDCYFCDKQGYTTLIARYGDGGHEYVSQPITVTLGLVKRSPEMIEDPIYVTFAGYFNYGLKHFDKMWSLFNDEIRILPVEMSQSLEIQIEQIFNNFRGRPMSNYMIQAMSNHIEYWLSNEYHMGNIPWKLRAHIAPGMSRDLKCDIRDESGRVCVSLGLEHHKLVP